MSALGARNRGDAEEVAISYPRDRNDDSGFTENSMHRARELRKAIRMASSGALIQGGPSTLDSRREATCLAGEIHRVLASMRTSRTRRTEPRRVITLIAYHVPQYDHCEYAYPEHRGWPLLQ
jgi:hypothetical protein